MRRSGWGWFLVAGCAVYQPLCSTISRSANTRQSTRLDNGAPKPAPAVSNDTLTSSVVKNDSAKAEDTDHGTDNPEIRALTRRAEILYEIGPAGPAYLHPPINTPDSTCHNGRQPWRY